MSYLGARSVKPKGCGATTNFAPEMLLETSTSLWLVMSSKVRFPAFSLPDVLSLFSFLSFRQD